MNLNNIEYTLNVYTDADILFEQLKNQPDKYDLLLLDIILDKKNGIELASSIRAQENSVSIIFITNSEDFMLQGYEVEPSGYLLKPVDNEKLESAIIKAYKKSKHNSIVVNNNSSTSMFMISDIMYIEILNKTLTVHLSDDRIVEVKMPLNKFYQKLPPDKFVQCHRCYVVSLSSIFSIKRYEILLNNHKKIPVSKRHYNDVQKALLQWATLL